MYSIFLVLLVRVAVSVYFCNGAARASIYGALVFLPVLALVNAIFAGLLCTRLAPRIARAGGAASSRGLRARAGWPAGPQTTRSPTSCW